MKDLVDTAQFINNSFGHETIILDDGFSKKKTVIRTWKRDDHCLGVKAKSLTRQKIVQFLKLYLFRPLVAESPPARTPKKVAKRAMPSTPSLVEEEEQVSQERPKKIPPAPTTTASTMTTTPSNDEELTQPSNVQRRRRNILLGVTGSVAAVKAPEIAVCLCRELNAHVKILLTAGPQYQSLE
jgi:hypothetical protein